MPLQSNKKKFLKHWRSKMDLVTSVSIPFLLPFLFSCPKCSVGKETYQGVIMQSMLEFISGSVPIHLQFPIVGEYLQEMEYTGHLAGWLGWFTCLAGFFLRTFQARREGKVIIWLLLILVSVLCLFQLQTDLKSRRVRWEDMSMEPLSLSSVSHEALAR